LGRDVGLRRPHPGAEETRRTHARVEVLRPSGRGIPQGGPAVGCHRRSGRRADRAPGLRRRARLARTGLPGSRQGPGIDDGLLEGSRGRSFEPRGRKSAGRPPSLAWGADRSDQALPALSESLGGPPPRRHHRGARVESRRPGTAAAESSRPAAARIPDGGNRAAVARRCSRRALGAFRSAGLRSDRPRCPRGTGPSSRSQRRAAETRRS
jgi:hypothetical protein